MVNSYNSKSITATAEMQERQITADLQKPEAAKATYSGKMLKGVHKIMLGLALVGTIATASAQELSTKQAADRCNSSEVQVSGQEKPLKIGIDYELENAYKKFKKGKYSAKDFRAIYVTPLSAEIISANKYPQGKLSEVSDLIMQELECNYQDDLKKPKKAVAKAKPKEERKYESEYSTLPNGAVVMTQRFVEPPSKVKVEKKPKEDKLTETTVYKMPHDEYVALNSPKQEETPKQEECAGCTRTPEQEDEIAKIIEEKTAKGDILAGIADRINTLDFGTRQRLSELDFTMEQISKQEEINTEAVDQVFAEVGKIQRDLASEVERIRLDLDDYPTKSDEDKEVVSYLLEKMYVLDVYLAKKNDDYAYMVSVHGKSEAEVQEVAKLSEEIDTLDLGVKGRFDEVSKAVEQFLMQSSTSAADGGPQNIVIEVPKIEARNDKDGEAFVAMRLFEEAGSVEMAASKSSKLLLLKIESCKSCTDKLSMKAKVFDTIAYAAQKKEEYAYVLGKYAGKDLMKETAKAEEQPKSEEKVEVAEPEAVKAEEKKDEKRTFAIAFPVGSYYSEISFLGKEMRQWGASAPLILNYPCTQRFGVSLAAAGDLNYYDFKNSGMVEQWNAFTGFGVHLILKDRSEKDWVLTALTTFSNDKKGVVVGEILSIKSNVMDANLIGTFNRSDPIKGTLHVWDTESKYPFMLDSRGMYSKSKNFNSEYDMMQGSLRMQFPLGYDLPAYANIVAGATGNFMGADPNMFLDAYGIVGASVTWKYVNVGAGALLGKQHSKRFIPGVGTYEHNGVEYNGTLDYSEGFKYGYTVFGSFKMANIRDVLNIRAGVEYSSVGKNWTVVPELGMIIVW